MPKASSSAAKAENERKDYVGPEGPTPGADTDKMRRKPKNADLKIGLYKLNARAIASLSVDD